MMGTVVVKRLNSLIITSENWRRSLMIPDIIFFGLDIKMVQNSNMIDFEPLPQATVRTREEKIGKILSIQVTPPPQSKPSKMQINCTRIRVRSIKCRVQSRHLTWRLTQNITPLLLVSFKPKDRIEKETPTGTVLDGIHYVGQPITLTAMQQPIRLSSHS